GTPREIAFRARVEADVPARRIEPLQPPTTDSKVALMGPRLSPDGTTIAFAAVGDAWTYRIGDAAPVRLTRTPDRSEIPLGFTRDGGSLLVLLRGDEVEGPLAFVPLRLGGRSDVIGKKRDPFDDGCFTPDGSAILASAGEDLVRI